MSTPEPPPLLAVALVFESKPEFTELPHVASTVSAFVNSSVELPLHEACRFGSITLLDRLWISSEIYADSNVNFTDESWSLRKFLRTDKHYRQYQFTLSLQEAVKMKNLEMVQWLCARFQGLTVTRAVVDSICEVGSIDMLQFLFDQLAVYRATDSQQGVHVEWEGSHLPRAVASRRGDIVWWLLKRLPDVAHFTFLALESAFKNGDIPMAQSLLLNGVRLPRAWRGKTPAHCVAANGHLDALQWMAERGQLIGKVGFVGCAAENGHLEVVRWLIEHYSRTVVRDEEGYTLEDAEGSHCIHIAASNGHLEIAKYLRERQKDAMRKVHLAIYEEQRRQVVRRSESIPYWDKFGEISWETMVSAAGEGHLDVVEWLREEYPEIDFFHLKRYWVEDCVVRRPKNSIMVVAMDIAACCGHLQVVQYLHQLQAQLESDTKKRKRDAEENRVPPLCTKGAMDGAAGGGHLHIVQWLHHNRTEGCSTNAMIYAARAGQLKILRWLHQNRTEGWTTEAMDAAAGSGQLHVVQWLHANTTVGCTTEAMNLAARFGHFEVVKWLHTHRSEGCTVDAMNGAAENGHLEVVKWLHYNRSEGCTTKAMRHAVLEGHYRVVKWLYSHRTKGCSENFIDSAVAGKSFEVVLFLHSQRSQQVTADGAELAARYGDKDICAWVDERYPQF